MITKKLAVMFAVPAILSGCYVVPAGPDSAAYVVPAAGPATLQARLYPANDLASQTGVLRGVGTNFMTGKGRLQIDHQGELLVGEATRVPGDERRGVASLYGQRGTFINCEYLMNTPYQGTGTCTASTGARYTAHIGS